MRLCLHKEHHDDDSTIINELCEIEKILLMIVQLLRDQNHKVKIIDSGVARVDQ